MGKIKDRSKVFLVKLLEHTRNFIIFLLILAFIGCFKNINSYNVSLSVYCLSTVLVLLPLINKLLSKINIVLTKYQKLFIIFFTYLPLGFINKVNQTSYIQTLITFLLTILVWVLVCIYSKYKKIK